MGQPLDWVGPPVDMVGRSWHNTLSFYLFSYVNVQVESPHSLHHINLDVNVMVGYAEGTASAYSSLVLFSILAFALVFVIN